MMSYPMWFKGLSEIETTPAIQADRFGYAFASVGGG